jgi:hypothetical protein
MTMNFDVVHVHAYQLGTGATLASGHKILRMEKRGKGLDKIVNILAISEDKKSVRSRTFKHYEMVEVLGFHLDK